MALSEDYLRHLMALAASRGEDFWAAQLADLLDENVIGRCPACGNESIVPTDANGVTGGAVFLHGEAMRAGEHRIAAAIAALCDEGMCPRCGERFRIEPWTRS